jgi:hypothetical protein
MQQFITELGEDVSEKKQNNVKGKAISVTRREGA